MKVYQGVVEDINDPLKMSRVRVRVFGLHTDDKSKIPTDSLPWATVAFPTTSASISGIGASPSGLLNGSWVYLFFTDPDEQYPVIFATLPGLPKDNKKPTDKFEDSDKSTNQAEEDKNTKTDAEQSKESETDSIASGEIDPSKLGSVSKKYESNGNPGTINNYKKSDDKGGASYGAYQFASYTRDGINPTTPDVSKSQVKNSPINSYIAQSKYAKEFSGLVPGTSAFDSKWKEVAKRDSVAFLADQHKYIERNYYQQAINKLPTEITDRGLAVHEAIWSMSVQLGPSGAVNKIKQSVGKPDSRISDQTIIEKIYDSRLKTVQSDFKSSPGQWDGLRKRFKSESQDLVSLSNTYSTNSNTQASLKKETKTVYTEDGATTETEENLVADDSNTSESKGFNDPSGVYPNIVNEPDTNRLSRGIIKGTHVKTKRNSLITGCNAGEVQISEPPTQYNAKYPYNHVTETQSGHILELDDTPGYERIHTFHKSGTFTEYHPDGGLVTKVKRKRTDVVIDDWNSICIESVNDFIGKNFNRSIAGKSFETVKEDAKYIVKKEYEIISDERIKLSAPSIEMNSGGKIDSKIKFAQSKDQLKISKAILQTPTAQKPDTSTAIQDDENASKITDDYTASQNNDGENPYKNEEAAADGVKENYPGTPEDSELENKQTQKSDNDASDIIAVLNKRLAEAAKGQWRETGQGGKESNPNIIGIWTNLGFPNRMPWTSDQTAWCAGFMNLVLKESGYDYVQSASAKAISQAPHKWNATRVKASDVQPGDIAVWKYSHVNFVYSVKNGKLSFVGGNQSPQTLNRNPNDGDVTISYKNGTSPTNTNIESFWRVTKG